MMGRLSIGFSNLQQSFQTVSKHPLMVKCSSKTSLPLGFVSSSKSCFSRDSRKQTNNNGFLSVCRNQSFTPTQSSCFFLVKQRSLVHNHTMSVEIIGMPGLHHHQLNSGTAFRSLWIIYVTWQCHRTNQDRSSEPEY